MMPEQYRVTAFLAAARLGNRTAVSDLFRGAYRDLRRIAAALMRNERPNHMLQPTALVNELYLKIFAGQTPDAATSTHFYRLAATVMRKVLVDDARKRNAAKRGGIAVPLEDRHAAPTSYESGIVQLDMALRGLRREYPRAAEVFELNYFAGRDPMEIAKQMALSVRAIQRDLQRADLWLRRELTEKADVARTAAKG
jgi:RNA polymerase sigma factor (TIGR02999 family)